MSFLDFFFETLSPANVSLTTIGPSFHQVTPSTHLHYGHHHHSQRETEGPPTEHHHEMHHKNETTDHHRGGIRRYNHTYLDHLDEMPPDVRDFINERYNGKFVMASIQPDSEYDWNVNNTGNDTILFPQRAPWQNIVDKVGSCIITFNVIGLMLGMGCAIYWRDIVSKLWPPTGIIIGMCGQFILLPATGFGFTILFKMKPYEAIGCLMISCSPGGAFSNFFTYWVEGDLALSILMTACSSIIAFVGMPFNLWLYSSYYVGEEANNIVIPYLNIFGALSFICGPVIVGMLIRHFNKKVAHIITRVTTIVGYVIFLIVLTIWTILYWKMLTIGPFYIYVSAVILPITGFTSAYVLAFVLRRTHKVCRTIGIETGSQNIAVAFSIILLSFSDPEVKAKMALFPSMYGMFMLCEIFLVIGLYRSVTYCMDRSKKSKNYPNVCTARIESGTMAENVELSMGRNFNE